MISINFKKLVVNMEDLDRANDQVVTTVSKRMKDSGASEDQVNAFLVIQAKVQGDTMEVLFGKENYKALIEDKLETLKLRVGEFKMNELAQKAKEVADSNNKKEN